MSCIHWRNNCLGLVGEHPQWTTNLDRILFTPSNRLEPAVRLWNKDIASKSGLGQFQAHSNYRKTTLRVN